VRIYDVQNLQVTPKTVLSHSDEVLFTNVALSPDGHLLAAAGQTYSLTLAIWDLHQPQPTPTTIKGIGWVAFSPDGQTLASLGDN
jgi:WD40 repeat protein